MGGHPVPEIPCKICSKPIDLSIDLCTDENGRAIHEQCYFKHITAGTRNPPATMMAD